MSKVYILAEGETEEKFIKEILNPYFEVKGIFIQPICLRGIDKYSSIKKEVYNLLKDTTVKVVTTMIDLYGSPSDMPQKEQIKQDMNYIEKVEFLEDAFSKDISHLKFLPYLQLHEFESLLFSDVSHFSLLTKNIKIFEKIAIQKEPEEINDSPSTAPSKRIIKAIPEYEFSKPANGIILSKAIGLAKMREKCPHFNRWIDCIEKRCL